MNKVFKDRYRIVDRPSPIESGILINRGFVLTGLSARELNWFNILAVLSI